MKCNCRVTTMVGPDIFPDTGYPAGLHHIAVANKFSIRTYVNL